MEPMTEVRTTTSDPNELVVDTQAEDRPTDDSTEFQQQQLLPAGYAFGRSNRPNDRLRKAGLIGIAHAREALAEASRRAQARSESRAA
jgi:hypothetical protein